MGGAFIVIKNQFPLLAARIPVAVRVATAKTTAEAALGARAAAPVRRGFLRASIFSFGDAVEVGAPYGPYVEHGTRFMQAQPFFFPYVEQAGEDLPEVLKLALGWV